MKLYRIKHKREIHEDLDERLLDIGLFMAESPTHAIRVMVWDQSGNRLSHKDSETMMATLFDVSEESQEGMELDQLDYLVGMAGMVP